MWTFIFKIQGKACIIKKLISNLSEQNDYFHALDKGGILNMTDI